MDDLTTILDSAQATNVFLALSIVFVLLYVVGFVLVTSWGNAGDVSAWGALRARVQKYAIW